MGQRPHRFKENAVSQAAKIGQDIGIPSRIWWTGTTFTVDHDLLPRVQRGRLDSNLILTGRPLPETKTGQALIVPCEHICFHSGPPHNIFHELVSLFASSVVTENPDVHLQEHPLLPSQMTSRVPRRDYWDPVRFFPATGLRLDVPALRPQRS